MVDTDTRERLIRVETKLDMLLEATAIATARMTVEQQELIKRVAALEMWKTRVVTLYGAAIAIMSTVGGSVTAYVISKVQ